MDYEIAEFFKPHSGIQEVAMSFSTIHFNSASEIK